MRKLDQCVPTAPLTSNCGDGGIVVGGVCFPADPSVLCGNGTRYNPVTQRCESTGASDCMAQCSAPSSSAVCIQGTVGRFVDDQLIDPAVAAQLKIWMYDPFALAGGNTTPLATSMLEASGCFTADGVMRPQQGLVLLTIAGVDTFSMPPSDALPPVLFALALTPGQNSTGLSTFYLDKSTVDAWNAAIGPIPTCADLRNCGSFILQFTDSSSRNVGNVQPTLAGSPADPQKTFCFRGNRSTLTTQDTTDLATGTCLLAPDTQIIGHSGVCATGGCMCAGGNCSFANPSMPWPTATGSSQMGFFAYAMLLGQ